ncbi:MAG: hypothetical protein WKF79_00185 [Nocardioides sp.]
MTLIDWLWLAFALFGPLPLVWAWRWRQALLSARNVRETMEYRREKFGGFVSLPRAKDGKREVLQVERPR